MSLSLLTYTTCNIWYGCYALTTTITQPPAMTTVCNVYGCFAVTVASSTPTPSASLHVTDSSSSEITTSASVVVASTSTPAVTTSASPTSKTQNTGSGNVASSVSSPSSAPTTSSLPSPRPTTISTITSLPRLQSISTTTPIATIASLVGAGVNSTSSTGTKLRSRGMSTGAIVAAVIVPVVFIALMGIFAFLFVRRRRRARQDTTHNVHPLPMTREKDTNHYGAAAAPVVTGGAATMPFAAVPKSAPQIQTTFETDKVFPDPAYFTRDMAAELPGDPAPPSYHSRNTSKAASHTPSNSRSDVPPTNGAAATQQHSPTTPADPFATPSPTRRTQGPFDTPDHSPTSGPTTVRYQAQSTSTPIPFLLPRKSANSPSQHLRPTLSPADSKDDFLSDNDYGDEEAEIGLAQRASVMRVPSIGSAYMLEHGGSSSSPRTSADRAGGGRGQGRL